MATLVFPFAFTGSIGDITFVRTKNGIVAKAKRSPIGKKFKTDPQYQGQRGRCAEFGRAAKAPGLLRNTFSEYVPYGCDSLVHNRLVSALSTVIRSAPGSKGERLVANGDLTVLEGFALNKTKSRFADRVPFPFNCTYDRETGLVRPKVPQLSPAMELHRTPSATHFRLVLVAAHVDFTNQKAESASIATGYQQFADQVASARCMELALSPGNDHPCFIALVVECFSNTNDIYYPVSDRSCTPYNIIKVCQ